MFGIGLEELMVIGLLVLVLFGPEKLLSIARELGRFASEAQNTVEELKSELVSSEEVNEARRSAEKSKSELVSARRSIDEEFKTEIAFADEEGRDDHYRKGSKNHEKAEV
jgi:Sec-independent protein translocase protein TatA